jgi:signal transduction histidine kinase
MVDNMNKSLKKFATSHHTEKDIGKLVLSFNSGVMEKLKAAPDIIFPSQERSYAKTSMAFAVSARDPLIALVHLIEVGATVSSETVKIDRPVLESATSCVDGVIYLMAKYKLHSASIAKSSKDNEELSQMQRVAADFRHDLTTPLQGIKGFLDMAMQEKNTLQKSLFSLVLDSGLKTAIDMLNQFSEFFETGAARLEPEKIILSDFSGKMAKSMSFLSGRKNITITNKIIDDNISVLADPTSLSRIFSNLLKNAIKFSNAGTEISISCKIEGGMAKVSVQDQGVGISEKNLACLLNGEKITTLGTGKEKGTGLGTKIVKELVEKNGGRFGIESRQGEGTTVSFTLPLARALTQNSVDGSLK